MARALGAFRGKSSVRWGEKFTTAELTIELIATAQFSVFLIYMVPIESQGFRNGSGTEETKAAGSNIQSTLEETTTNTFSYDSERV
jgi:hypothetical protein